MVEIRLLQRRTLNLPHDVAPVLSHIVTKCCFVLFKRNGTKICKAYSSDVCEAVRRNFYVDDCLVSVATVEQTQSFAKDLKNLLLQGGFSLKKWASNYHEALVKLPER